MTTPAPFLNLTNIAKSFDGVHALRDIAVTIRRGTVHALVGENGAGKSTLGKVIAGVHGEGPGNHRDRWSPRLVLYAPRRTAARHYDRRSGARTRSNPLGHRERLPRYRAAYRSFRADPSVAVSLRDAHRR
ncbi:ATP-binding cassette domain-containing protein [Microbacterium oxydans]|nr:ATP-binding cassette domain-containing protein [Microbacterium oxydans]